MGNLSGGCTNVLRELPMLASRLERRYPGVQVIGAYLSPRSDGQLTQTLQYRAPIEVLQAHGLVKEHMLKLRNGYSYGVDGLGDWFVLSDKPVDGVPGCWELHIATGPDDEHRKNVATKKLQRAAAKLLRPFVATAPFS